MSSASLWFNAVRNDSNRRTFLSTKEPIYFKLIKVLVFKQNRLCRSNSILEWLSYTQTVRGGVWIAWAYKHDVNDLIHSKSPIFICFFKQ